MSLFEVGRLCLKIAGRDAGRKCVVVEDAKEGYVVVDGDVRRKKVNVKHLEPLSEMEEIKGTTHEDVKKAFETLSLSVWDKKSKKPAERPKKIKKVKPKKESKPKKAKKAEIKAQQEQVKAEELTKEVPKEKIKAEKDLIKQEKEEVKN